MERATIRVIQVAVIAAAHESGSGLTARLSAGNPQGATTRITTIEDGGRGYNVVFLTQTGPKGRISRPRLPDCHACFHGEFRGDNRTSRGCDENDANDPKRKSAYALSCNWLALQLPPARPAFISREKRASYPQPQRRPS